MGIMCIVTTDTDHSQLTPETGKREGGLSACAAWDTGLCLTHTFSRYTLGSGKEVGGNIVIEISSLEDDGGR